MLGISQVDNFGGVQNWYQFLLGVKNWYQYLTHGNNWYQYLTRVKNMVAIVHTFVLEYAHIVTS